LLKKSKETKAKQNKTKSKKNTELNLPWWRQVKVKQTWLLLAQWLFVVNQTRLSIVWLFYFSC
jgi:hypothetical protein